MKETTRGASQWFRYQSRGGSRGAKAVCHKVLGQQHANPTRKRLESHSCLTCLASYKAPWIYFASLHRITRISIYWTFKKTELTPFILAIPGQGQHNFQVLYKLGTWAGATGIKENDLKSSLLALLGEFVNGVSLPTVMALPSSIVTRHKIKIPSMEEFEEARIKDHSRPTEWFKV